jgi:HlyD family secretion protein
MEIPRDNTAALGQPRKAEPPPLLQTAPGAPLSKRKGHGKLIIFIVIVVLLLGVTMYFALGKKEPAINVQTEKVSRHTITETVVANGKIYPVLQVHLSAEVSGEIIELPVKEGEFVHKGDLLLKINPKTPLAELNEAKANYASSQASVATATANLEKAQTDFKRNKELFNNKLLSESDYIGFKVALDVGNAQLDAAGHAVEVAKASVDSAQDEFDKTTITAPMDGTITVLNSQLGERVLGTVQNAGTEIMTISDLSRMEARVNIGEMDIVLLQPGQKAKLEVDSFKDRKFAGAVTDVANSSLDLDSSSSLGGSSSSSSSGQAATQFQVRIRMLEGDSFRPGMSVNATIETRTRTNTIAAPIASVTTRVVKSKSKPNGNANANGQTNSVSETNALAQTSGTNSATGDKKTDDRNKPVDVVFVVDGNHVKTVPVKIGISDDNFWEITDGLKEGDEIVVGGFKAIGRDLDDGKKITKNAAGLAAK